LQYGCPLCNGLIQIDQCCPRCGQVMRDEGMIEDYYGPYSPYDDMDVYEPPEFRNLTDTMTCVHLLACRNCGCDTRLAVPLAEMG